MSKAQLSFLILIVLAIAWGLSFIFIKKLSVEFTGLEIGAGRIWIAGMFLLPWAIKNRKDLPADKIKYIFLSGLIGYLIPAIIFGFAGRKISSSLSGTLNATTPIFVLLFGALFFKKRILPMQAVGIFLGFVGSLVLVNSAGSFSFDINNPFAILILLATLLYGLNTNILSNFLRDVRPIVISSFSVGFVSFFAFLLLLTTDFFYKISHPSNLLHILYFLILGVLNSGLAAVLYNYLLKITTPVFASTVTYLIPVVAILAGVFDGEHISFMHLLGMGIILGSIFILNKK